MKEAIKAKALLGLKLTENEEALYLLLIASEQEVDDYLKGALCN